MKVRAITFLVLTVLALAGPVPVARGQVALPSQTQRVPVEPAITVGRLPNGLRYYIRANSRPENRAELRLVVNAGSILEDDDQLGLAHFVEHMAFNGTQHFRKQEIGAFMESIGMRFGPSLNAFTGFDDTTYVLQVPTDKPGVLDRAFLIMEDWARGVLFEPEEIDKERGVIIEEWRLGRGAGARLQEKVFPILLKGSRYVDRNPIGTKASLETFTHDRLKRFYADWYRPDLMAVVAVGDFTPADIEKRIRRHFAPIPPAIAPRPRPLVPVPPHPGTLFAIATDKETSGASIAIYNKLPLREQSTVSSYRQRMIDHLYANMLNARLAELSQKPEAPFMQAGVNRAIFVRSIEAATLTSVTQPEGIARAFEAMLTESERVARHGFTVTEFEREKRDLLRLYEQASDDGPTQDSTPLAEEYIRAFLTDESIPGIAWEYEQHKAMLPGITLAEVNALAREWNGDHNRVVVVSGPDKPGLKVPNEAELAAVIAKVAKSTIAAYEDSAHAAALIESLPAPGTIARERVDKDAGLTEWVLSNGVRVALRPTTFKQDEVIFRAVSPGGTSLASDRDFVPAVTASQVVAAGGVGAFDLTALRKVLSGTVVSVSPTIDETTEGLAGGASGKDLETMFQLIHLYFTKPRADATVFDVMTGQMKSLVANRAAMPDVLFEDTVQTLLGQGHVRRRPLSAEVVGEMNLASSYAFYKDRFADAGDFTFVFVGSFDVEAMKPLVTRYLASLPSQQRTESWKDDGIDPPRGVVEKTLEMGIEPKSRVRIVFAGAFRWSPAERLAMRTMTMVLEGLLGERLREDQSGTYGVQVTSGTQKYPDQEYTVSIDFSCAPERTEALTKMAFDLIARLRMEGPTEGHVADIRQALMREYETSSRDNRYVAGRITDAYELGEDPNEYLRWPARVAQLDAATVRDLARFYLDPKNYVRVTQFPAKKQ